MQEVLTGVGWKFDSMYWIEGERLEEEVVKKKQILL